MHLARQNAFASIQLSVMGWASMLHTRQHPIVRRNICGFGVGASIHLTCLIAVASTQLPVMGGQACFILASIPLFVGSSVGQGGGVSFAFFLLASIF